MDSCAGLCQCDAGDICVLCKVLVVVGIVVVGMLIGYFIGKKKGDCCSDNSDKKDQKEDIKS